jgi:hypothetical protein
MHYSESTRMMIMMNLCTIKEKVIGRKNKKKKEILTQFRERERSLRNVNSTWGMVTFLFL